MFQGKEVVTKLAEVEKKDELYKIVRVSAVKARARDGISDR
jgi:hypothetical protein